MQAVSPEQRGASRLFWVALLIIALGGGGLLFWATERGIGLDPDSAHYLDCAANLARGRGYSTSLHDYYNPLPLETYVREVREFGAPRARPEIHYPPFFSFCLSLALRAGLPPLEAARYLMLILLGANIFLVGLTVWKLTPRSIPASLAAALIALGAESVLVVHTAALSEPLFIFLALSGFLFLSAFLRRNNALQLLGGSVLIGLAFLTRITGGALVAAGALGLLIAGRRPLKKRLRNAAVFTVLSCVPAALYFIRNLSATGMLTSRHLGLNLLGSDILRILLSTLSSWVFPGAWRRAAGGGPFYLLSLASVAALAILVVLLGAGFRREAKSKPLESAGAPGSRPGLVFYGLSIPAYVLLHATALLFVDSKVIPDLRLLSPLFISVLIVAVVGLLRTGRMVFGDKGIKALQALAGLYVVGCLAAGAFWLWTCHARGRGYHNDYWRSREVQTAAATLSRESRLPLITNDDAAVYFLAHRYAYDFAFGDHIDHLDSIRAEIGPGPVIFVYFKSPVHAQSFGEALDQERTERAFQDGMGLTPLLQNSKVSIFRYGD
jgi:4-amino-4-deoxy-L-arabinose transferase-like glycosyltransferase